MTTGLPPGPDAGPGVGDTTPAPSRPAVNLRARTARFLRDEWGVAVVLLVGQVGIAVGALVVNVVSARTLGPTGRGQLALYLQVAYIASQAALLGREAALLAVRPTGDPTGSALSAGTRLLRLPALLAGPVAVVGTGLVAGAHAAALGTAAALFVLIAANCSHRMVRSVAIIDAAPWLFTGPVLVAQVLLILAGSVLLATGHGEVVVWLLLYAVTLAAPFAVVLVTTRGRTSLFTAAELRQTRSLGLRLMPSTVAQMVLLRADRLLLPSLASYRELGLYVVAATMTEMTNWPVRQLVDSSTPRWARQYRDGTLRPLRILLRVTLLAAVLGALVGAATYVTLPWLFGAQYAEARPLVPFLTAGVVFYSASLVGIAVATVAGLARWAFWIGSSGMFVAAVGYVVLIPAWGALGAAVASAAGYLLCWLLAVVAISRVILARRRSGTAPGQ